MKALQIIPIIFFSNIVLANEPFNYAEAHQQCRLEAFDALHDGKLSLNEWLDTCGRKPTAKEKRDFSDEELRRIGEKYKQKKLEKQLKADERRRELERYRNTKEYKTEQKKRQVAESRCAKETLKAKTDYSANLIYSTCMQDNGF